MSVKLLLLKSGDQIISDVKEIVRSEGESRVVEGYLFSKPHKISAIKPVVLTENFNDERNVEVTLSPWILLTEDKSMTVPQDWIITIVNPIGSILKMYEEKTNG